MNPPRHLCPNCGNDEITHAPATYICRRCRFEWKHEEENKAQTALFIAVNERITQLQTAILNQQDAINNCMRSIEIIQSRAVQIKDVKEIMAEIRSMMDELKRINPDLDKPSYVG
jgi:seryl-tRNA synthetase